MSTGSLRAALLALGGLVLAGCGIHAPTYPLPFKYSEKPGWKLAPGFDPTRYQVARWTCLSMPSTNEMIPVPRVDLVLLKHPTRGLLLHELTNDWLMEPSKTIAGGGIVFSVFAVDPDSGQEKDSFTVPPDYQENLSREWDYHMNYSRISYESKQQCKPGPPVRFL